MGGGGYSASENATINTAFNTYGAINVCAAGNGDESSGARNMELIIPLVMKILHLFVRWAVPVHGEIGQLIIILLI